MKYIRTKDGRILNMSRYVYDKTAHWYRERIDITDHIGLHYFCWKDEFDKIPDILGKLLVEQLDKKECDFANTIEELCDEFVMTDCDTEIRPFISSTLIPLQKGTKIHKDYEIYGAIWTEWGLKYVAKMNEKGELELL